MNKLLGSIRCALPGFVLLIAAANCQAGSIQLNPVRIDLSDAAKVAVLTVRNTGSEESVVQVTLNKWTPDGQAYAYEQSQELVITPTTFRLAPDQQQIVRIGLRQGPPTLVEGSYRLLVEEVPPPPLADISQTRLVIRHDVPVFVAPMAVSKAALEISVECAADGDRLRLTNIGKVHALLRNLRLEGNSSAQFIAEWDTFDYLLPEAQKSWMLSQVAPEAGGRGFLLTAQTDQGSFTADVKNSCH
jgi:fimbrial chaperone protein